MRTEARASVLASFGAAPEAASEVLAYCEPRFGLPTVPAPVFPLSDEPHVEDWRRYAAQAGRDVLGFLQARLPQLNVPIRPGISTTPAYAAVARQGQPFDAAGFGERLRIASPAALRLEVHEHPAGALPVLVTPDRADFETLVRAFASRSEPEPIAAAVNAQMVAGFINWDRMAGYRSAWSAQRAAPPTDDEWMEERARIAATEKWRFQDRLIVTCERPYSDVAARELPLGLDDEAWLKASTVLRVEHEFTHYATKRVLGFMSLNLWDETIADCMGMTRALGTFRGDVFLRFLGLEGFPAVRESGRIHTYSSSVGGPAFALLCAVVVRASAQLERIVAECDVASDRGRFLLALCALSLEQLAAPDARELFRVSYDEAARLVQPGAFA
jgi:hypothetical protein